MKIRYFIVNLFITSCSISTFASNAICKIQIQDNYKNTKYVVEQKFDIVEGGAGRTKNFDPPGGEYNCVLHFFDLKSGTMISCNQNKDNGKTFVQSDRTGIKEKPVSNTLSFRTNKTFVTLNASCE